MPETEESKKKKKRADKFSKIIVFGDWFLTSDLFEKLKVARWGVATMDRFTTERNLKIMKSKYICQETLGIDAFMFDWAGELNCASGKSNRENCEKLSLINNSL